MKVSLRPVIGHDIDRDWGLDLWAYLNFGEGAYVDKVMELKDEKRDACSGSFIIELSCISVTNPLLVMELRYIWKSTNYWCVQVLHECR